MPQEQVSHVPADAFAEYRSLLAHVRLGFIQCENVRGLPVEDSERRFAGVVHAAIGPTTWLVCGLGLLGLLVGGL